VNRQTRETTIEVTIITEQPPILGTPQKPHVTAIRVERNTPIEAAVGAVSWLVKTYESELGQSLADAKRVLALLSSAVEPTPGDES
jgi:hypothetical protein